MPYDLPLPPMKPELTEQILSLRPNDHLCWFYDRDPAEQMAAIVPFVADRPHWLACAV